MEMDWFTPLGSRVDFEQVLKEGEPKTFLQWLF
jgi:hypothetical protein